MRNGEDLTQIDPQQHLGTHPVPARLLDRSWHAWAIAARLCSPARPPVFDGETPGPRHHHHAYIASTPASPRWWN